MSKRLIVFIIAGLLTIVSAWTMVSNSQTTQPSTPPAVLPPSPNSYPKLSRMFDRIWQVTQAPTQPARGSIFIFLANGTLLQTSCTETYRIATWTIAKTAPDILRVVEDGRLVYTAKIVKLTDTNLQLDRTLLPINKRESISLTAVSKEFVCPDLPKK
jgi:hypothetical protein